MCIKCKTVSDFHIGITYSAAGNRHHHCNCHQYWISISIYPALLIFLERKKQIKDFTNRGVRGHRVLWIEVKWSDDDESLGEGGLDNCLTLLYSTLSLCPQGGHKMDILMEMDNILYNVHVSSKPICTLQRLSIAKCLRCDTNSFFLAQRLVWAIGHTNKKCDT